MIGTSRKNFRGLLKKLSLGVHGHQAFKAALEACFLAIDLANQAFHDTKLLGVTRQKAFHAGIELF